MKNMSMIAAIGKNNELGKDGKLIWPIREDLKFFKEQTMGKPIIMGRKTLESLPKLLPGRQHIVLTNHNLDVDPSIIIIHSKEELLDYVKAYQKEVMVIGGASIYDQLLEESDKLILTEIDREDRDADAYFPYFNKEDYDQVVLSEHIENDIPYKHLVYTRKNNH